MACFPELMEVVVCGCQAYSTGVLTLVEKSGVIAGVLRPKDLLETVVGKAGKEQNVLI